MSFLRNASGLVRVGVLAASAVAVIELAVAASGCLLIYKTNEEQCSVDADCAKFVGTYCNRDQQICLKRDGYCTTNAQCIDRNGGRPFICIKDPKAPSDNHCVDLNGTPACKEMFGETELLRNDDAVVLGFVNNYVDSRFTFIGGAQKNAVKLAHTDLMKNAAGLPPARPGGRSRPLVWVVCDGTTAPLADTFNYLIDQVKVPAIHGPAFSGDVVQMANTKTISSKTVIISPSAGSALISVLPSKEPRLVWRTVPSDTLNAKVITTVVPTMVERDLKGPGGTVPSGKPMRVAVVHKGDAFGRSFADLLFQTLRFNDMSASDNANQGAYQAINYGDPADPNVASKYADAVSRVLGMNPLPHLIIYPATAEVIANVFVPIERGWPSSAGYLPRYIFATGGAKTTDLLKKISELGTPNLRTRIMGTEPGSASNLFNKFKAAYTNEFGTDAPPGGFYAGAAYDAAYILMYGVAAAGTQQLTGEAVAHGIEKLIPPGLGVNVGDLDAFQGAFGELSQGRNIDLAGVSGSLDYDIATGDTETDMGLWCVSPLAGANPPFTFNPSGLYYDSRSKALTGVYACPQ